jgi:hypothetical protein
MLAQGASRFYAPLATDFGTRLLYSLCTSDAATDELMLASSPVVWYNRFSLGKITIG